MNMTNVIMSYYIEVVNALMIFCTLPYVYVLCVGPLPLLPAQFAYTVVHCCASLIVALGSAVSCFHILYVTKFEILFSLDPQEVGRRQGWEFALSLKIAHIKERLLAIRSHCS